jgi:hypothetical protein
MPVDCKVQCVVGVPHPDTASECAVNLSDGSAMLRYAVVLDTKDVDVDVSFRGVRAFYFGAPNDEALDGHRLWGRGLSLLSFQEVHPSDWIAELQNRNRVHPQHSAQSFTKLRHFIVTFKETTLECVANELEVSHSLKGPHP